MKTNKKNTSSIINVLGTILLAAAVCISVPATTNAATSKKKTTAAAKTTKSPIKAPIETPIEAKTAPQVAAAKKLTDKLTATERTNLLTLLNEGETEDLVQISGIGITRAKAIAAARPFESVETLTLVDGIGDLTLTRIIAHCKTAK